MTFNTIFRILCLLQHLSIISDDLVNVTWKIRKKLEIKENDVPWTKII